MDLCQSMEVSSQVDPFAPIQNLFARVILPLNLDRPYSYFIPDEYVDKIRPGIRVEVQFGRSKLYAGMVAEVYEEFEMPANYKSIVSVLDESPILQDLQLKLWSWIANYYCCNIGEVMNAALPSAFKLDSESKITIHPDFEQDFIELNDDEFLIAEALAIKKEATIGDIQKILNKKTVKKIIDQLVAKGVLLVEEELKEGIRDKKEDYIILDMSYRTNPDLLVQALDLVQRSDLQTKLLLALIQYGKPDYIISKKELSKHVEINLPVLKALEKKGILKLEKRKQHEEVNKELLINLPPLSYEQIEAIASIHKCFDDGKQVALLHGVTGSGKTRVYNEFIKETVEAGGQVLYLLPEIALTSHLIHRLKKVLGNNLVTYHSKLSQRMRVETWKSIMAGAPIVLAARSGIFLPFSHLKLIIVDEEHDPSYKQHDPDPRYQARDTAIWLGSSCNAKVILGSATPSIDSYFNIKQNKYGLATLQNRFSETPMPDVELVDLAAEHRARTEPFIISTALDQAIKRVLRQKDQIILFQNRRGYAPQQYCSICHWHSMCPNCDVSLTFHKYFNKLICHYCGYSRPLYTECPDCGKTTVNLKGFGTEKIEDELIRLYPEARIKRLDLDTARTVTAYQDVLEQFEEKKIDILVGTQMISKGLDFDHVALVGILHADSIFYFPQFRANERAYQLITQVAGRAGRKDVPGKVILQAFNLNHPVIRYIMSYDYIGLAESELNDREATFYPPFSRLIEIVVKHKKAELADRACLELSTMLQSLYADRVMGPLTPGIPRIRNYFLKNILIKIEKNARLITEIKYNIKICIERMQKIEGFSTVRVNVDVDPD